MKHRYKFLLVVIIILIAAGANADECDKQDSSEAVANCLGKELRDSDAKINQTYQLLMGRISKDEKDKLRSEQRAWIKARDAECKCASKETNREKWYQGLLADYRKTVCVTRYTRQRTAELEHMATSDTAKPKEAPPVPAQPNSKADQCACVNYQAMSKAGQTKGLWYFETIVNPGEIAKFSPTALWTGCVDQEAGYTYGSLAQVRGSDTQSAIYRLGFALDLKNGKIYYRLNGIWQKGAPGTSGGIDVKLGRSYRCGIESTALIAPLIERGYLQFNLGEKPFTYAIPDGYRPFAESTN